MKIENVNEIVKLGQKVTSNRGECIGYAINERKYNGKIVKVNKKSIIVDLEGVGEKKFNYWKSTDRDGLGFKMNNFRHFFKSEGNIYGIIEVM